MTWQELIHDIQAAGLKQSQIATFCGCRQSSISDLANGKTRDPKSSIGDSLKALHRKTVLATKRKKGA